MVSSYFHILLEHLKVTSNASEVQAQLTVWSHTSVSHYNRSFLSSLSLKELQTLFPDVGLERARLGPAARLGPQLLGVRLKPRKAHGGIIGEILAEGRKSP